MQGFALTTEQIYELLSVYATADQTIDAVAATPGWHVIGAFMMPATYGVRVDALGSVSDAALTMRVRLFDITPGSLGPVSGSEASTTSRTDVRFYGGSIELMGGHTYQFQAEVTGGAGSSLYGAMRRATLEGV
jgi:hypothetical protein